MSFKNRAATNYAKALFEIVFQMKSNDENFDVADVTFAEGEDEEEEVEMTFKPDIFIVAEELLILRTTLLASKGLKEIFQNPTYLEQRKLDSIFSIYPGLTTLTSSFLRILAERSHLYLIPYISDEYTKLLLKAKNSMKVKIILANMLHDSSGSVMLRTLRKITKGQEIVMDVTFSSHLLGGLILEYKTTSIDATLLKEFGLFFADVN